MNSAGRRQGFVFRGIGIAVLIFLGAPMLIVAVSALDPGDFFTFPPRELSPHWFVAFIADPSWRSALLLTLTIGALTALVSTVVGGLAGIGIARLSPRLRRFAYPLLLAPLTVPVMILAISFYSLALRLHVVGDLATFVIANALLSAPLVALFVTGAALGIDRRLELASLSCGASPLRTFFRITVPLVAPVAAVGGVVAFLLVMDEVTMSIFLVSPDSVPLGVMMFVEVRSGTAPIVNAASALLIAATIVIVASLSQLRNLLAARAGSAADNTESAVP